ncbi:MAG: hypothetical protein D6714_01760 [Bacteroidetes bacterium]|nr:MAG: hypothetical protein D6714_01760 [Bacteroidota bacterium]
MKKCGVIMFSASFNLKAHFRLRDILSANALIRLRKGIAQLPKYMRAVLPIQTSLWKYSV